MHAIDWAIVAAVLALMIGGAVVSGRHMKSVADFLAAGRTAGRYLISVSQGMAALGAITIIANFEMNYEAGFAMSWWGLTMGIFILIITVSGWVVYRFRQTRCLTLAEFFERRYSRRFRVFAGLVAFGAGLFNFGIFPAVGAKFFMYYFGLPLDTPMFAAVMAVLLGLALWFVFKGGQVAVIVTDFLQGIFVNIAAVAIMAYLLWRVDWSHVIAVLEQAPEGKSKINPFKTGHVEDFNIGYFLIGVVGVFYGALSWQGTQGYNTSAKSAHEAKMGSVLGNWRGIPQTLLLLVVPIIAYTVMHDAAFADIARDVEATVAGTSKEVGNQVRAALVLTKLLPVGLFGAFAAMMLAAFVSTHNTYLHSWGSIFIQDVVLPFRKKPLSKEEHLKLLRWSIVGVAVFIFVFSLLYRQSEYILMFFAITGAIFAGGSGAVIIGGLYWKRGTTNAAWTSMIVGSSIAVGGIVIRQFDEDFFINGQQFWAIAMGAATVLYIGISMLEKQSFDLDRLLHRGKYAIEGEMQVVSEVPERGWKVLGMGREFTRGDKVIYLATYSWTALWTVVFIAGTVYCLSNDVPDSAWARYWYVFIWLNLAVSLAMIVWFTIGGVRDLRAMLGRLNVMQRDATDDGIVHETESE